MTAPRIDRATEIERLAALETINYEVVRIDEAKRLGIRSRILDQEVAKKRRALPCADVLAGIERKRGPVLQ